MSPKSLKLPLYRLYYSIFDFRSWLCSGCNDLQTIHLSDLSWLDSKGGGDSTSSDQVDKNHDPDY